MRTSTPLLAAKQSADTMLSSMIRYKTNRASVPVRAGTDALFA